MRTYRAVGLASALRRARSSRRLGVFLVAYLLVSVAIGWRLVEVQVVSAEEYRSLAERQVQREVELPARRGRIYDRAGEPLALSLPASTVWANPRALDTAAIDPTFVAADLAPLLDRPLGELVELLGRDSGFVYLGRQVPRSVGQQITAMRLPGIGVHEEPRRSYPAGSLAAQVIGFAGLDGDGLSGVELSHEGMLAGTPGVLRQERAPGGVEISAAPREVVPSDPGEDVVLTLDRSIQHTAERVLADAVSRHDALGGSAVVLDADNGDVLAMASVPGHDPADLPDSDPYTRRNRTVTDVFEPGSVNKAMTIAAAVEEGLVDADEVLDVPEAVLVGGKRFTDSTPQPARRLSLTEVMAASSNVGTILVADRLGDELLHDYLGRFGLGAGSGLDFPGESGGIVPGLERWYATTRPTVAIGQGVSATLLQVAGVFQTIAGDGQRIEPRLVRGTVDADGYLDEAPPSTRHEVLSASTANAIGRMLAAVVDDGTGTAAAVPGHTVAGKTGTAQKPSETSRGYEEGAYIATFAGFAPVDDPAVVIAVMIDEPQGEYYGGTVAAPVFSELMDFTLGQRGVVPSRPEDRPEALPAGHDDDR